MQGLLELVQESKAQKSSINDNNELQDSIFRVVNQTNIPLDQEVNQDEQQEIEKPASPPKSSRYIKIRSSNLLSDQKSKKEQFQKSQSDNELEHWQFEVDLQNRQNKVREEDERRRAYELEQWKSALHQQIEESAELFNKETEQNVFSAKGITFEPYTPQNSWKEQFQNDMEKEIKTLDTEVENMKEMFNNSMNNLIRLLSATYQSGLDNMETENQQANWDSDDDYDLDTDTNYFSCSDSDESNNELEQDLSDISSVSRKNKRNTG